MDRYRTITLTKAQTADYLAGGNEWLDTALKARQYMIQAGRSGGLLVMTHEGNVAKVFGGGLSAWG